MTDVLGAIQIIIALTEAFCAIDFIFHFIGKPSLEVWKWSKSGIYTVLPKFGNQVPYLKNYKSNPAEIFICNLIK